LDGGNKPTYIKYPWLLTLLAYKLTLSNNNLQTLNNPDHNMKKIILSAIVIALLATSCAKKPETSSIPTNTPLHSALPVQYIAMGTDVDQLDVDFVAYKPDADCDKKVFDAARETVAGSTGINKVTIKGKNLTMTFERNKNVQPSKLSLTYNTDLYKAVYQKWQWSGYLLISNQNKLMPKDQFEKAVNVSVSAINTGDIATITSKSILTDAMIIEYTITSPNGSDPSISYNVQASTPITLTSQVKINCLIPGFNEPKSNLTIDWKFGITTTQKDLGNGVKSYSQQLYSTFVNKSLEEYIAGQYFTTKVYPIVK
jgi:hypothetical protein